MTVRFILEHSSVYQFSSSCNCWNSDLNATNFEVFEVFFFIMLFCSLPWKNLHEGSCSYEAFVKESSRFMGPPYSSGMSNKVKRASAKMYMFQTFNILRVKRILLNGKPSRMRDTCA